MRKAKGITLENLLYRPDFYFPYASLPRYEIIKNFLNIIIRLNKRNLFFFDVCADNIMITLSPEVRLTLIDAESCSHDFESGQNSQMPEFLWKIVSSGLSTEQFFSPLGQKVCRETLNPLLTAAFQYSFSPEKSGRGKNLSPSEWMKAFSL